MLDWEEIGLRDDEHFAGDSALHKISTMFESMEKVLHLMEFTGLLDKNGKEIYEGDIVFNHHVSKQDSGDVSFSDIHHAYIISYPRKKHQGCWDFMHGEEHCLEVIGNIYENPELLKV